MRAGIDGIFGSCGKTLGPAEKQVPFFVTFIFSMSDMEMYRQLAQKLVSMFFVRRGSSRADIVTPIQRDVQECCDDNRNGKNERYRPNPHPRRDNHQRFDAFSRQYAAAFATMSDMAIYRQSVEAVWSVGFAVVSSNMAKLTRNTHSGKTRGIHTIIPVVSKRSAPRA